jgi:hypothetical protein
MAKQLIWEDGLKAPYKGDSVVIARAICGTHIYRMLDYGVGPYLLVDNQNGWDCFSQEVRDLDEAIAVAQNHFDNIIAEMA